MGNARTAMLTQAQKDKSVIVDSDNPLNKARMNKHKSKWTEGYCIDGITGSETNERSGIDIDAWQSIGPSDVCQSIYNGNAVQTFWKRLFGATSTVPLVKQTFLRLMGSSGTVQHADYYYFKRDTHIFNEEDGRNAQRAAEEYLKENKLWNQDLYENECKNTNKEETENEKEDVLICSICRSVHAIADLDDARRQRLEQAKKRKSDFGMEGAWHCPSCAIAPLSIFTTWISLSELSSPKDSILAVVPYSHKLIGWDTPKTDSQLPSDFNWKLGWVIPKHVGYGDVIIFNIKTIHASSLNKSSPRCFRCSFDTRLQLMPVNKAKKKKKIKKKAIVSPHPGLKLKSVFNGDDEAEIEKDISERIETLKLEQ